jgi:hypothetical protein
MCLVGVLVRAFLIGDGIIHYAPGAERCPDHGVNASNDAAWL